MNSMLAAGRRMYRRRLAGTRRGRRDAGDTGNEQNAPFLTAVGRRTPSLEADHQLGNRTMRAALRLTGNVADGKQRVRKER